MYDGRLTRVLCEREECDDGGPALRAAAIRKIIPCLRSLAHCCNSQSCSPACDLQHRARVQEDDKIEIRASACMRTLKRHECRAPKKFASIRGSNTVAVPWMLDVRCWMLDVFHTQTYLATVSSTRYRGTISTRRNSATLDSFPNLGFAWSAM